MEEEKVCFMATENKNEELAEEFMHVYSIMIDTPLAINEMKEVIQFQIKSAEECLEKPGFLSPKDIEKSIVSLYRSLDRIDTIVKFLLEKDYIKKY